MGNSIKVVYLAFMLPLGFRVGGEFGAIIAVTLDNIPVYLIVAFGLWKEKISLLKQDAWTTLILAGCTAIFLLIRIMTGLGFPWGEIPPLH